MGVTSPEKLEKKKKKKEKQSLSQSSQPRIFTFDKASTRWIEF